MSTWLHRWRTCLINKDNVRHYQTHLLYKKGLLAKKQKHLSYTKTLNATLATCLKSHQLWPPPQITFLNWTPSDNQAFKTFSHKHNHLFIILFLPSDIHLFPHNFPLVLLDWYLFLSHVNSTFWCRWPQRLGNVGKSWGNQLPAHAKHSVSQYCRVYENSLMCVTSEKHDM